MAKRTEQAARFAEVPAFAAAEPWLQEAIVATIEAAEQDGRVHLFPARDAWLDGWARVEQDVTPEVAAHLLAHVPPPFYTTPEAAQAGHVLAERPTT